MTSALLTAALLAGCGSVNLRPAGQAGPAGQQGKSERHRAPVSPHRTAADPTPVPPQPVTIAFGGDVHFKGPVAERLADDPETALGPVTAVLSAADIAMVNLETAITTGGAPAPKTYTFRAPPVAFQALAAAGVDVVSMANNHGLDYGKTGLIDSLGAAADYDFPVVGIGMNAREAYAPHIVTIGNARVGFLGATQVIDTALIDEWTATATSPGLASAKKVGRLLQAVRRTRPKVDTLVIYLHWGRTLEACPLPRQRDLADKLINAGADVIVGTHAHRLLAGGFLEGAYVHYGLGNFVWYNSGGVGGVTGVLTLTVQGRDVRDTTWTPATISGGVPQIHSGTEAVEARQAWKSLRECTDLRGKERITPAGAG